MGWLLVAYDAKAPGHMFCCCYQGAGEEILQHRCPKLASDIMEVWKVQDDKAKVAQMQEQVLQASLYATLTKLQEAVAGRETNLGRWGHTFAFTMAVGVYTIPNGTLLRTCMGPVGPCKDELRRVPGIGECT